MWMKKTYIGFSQTIGIEGATFSIYRYDNGQLKSFSHDDRYAVSYGSRFYKVKNRIVCIGTSALAPYIILFNESKYAGENVWEKTQRHNSSRIGVATTSGADGEVIQIRRFELADYNE